MPRSELLLRYSLTETRHFRRLVDFLCAVDEHADRGDDYELRGMVRECFDDLRGFGAGRGDAAWDDPGPRREEPQ